MLIFLFYFCFLVIVSIRAEIYRKGPAWFPIFVVLSSISCARYLLNVLSDWASWL